MLGAFAVMLALGFSINVLTMFAMVLAIGILVDDAIVVVENVERIMASEGLSPKEATKKAMPQISGAIVGITLVLVTVFLPLAFMTGSVGVIYRQFSVAMAVSIFFSAFLALSFTPALCATILKPIPQGPSPGKERLLRLVQPQVRRHHAQLPELGLAHPAQGRAHDAGVRAAGGAAGLAVHAPAVVVPA